MTSLFAYARSLLGNHLTNTLHPDGFHGERRKRKYFEGWYVKVVSADRAHKLAIIPGIFLGPNGEDDVFIQVLDGATSQSSYHRFPLSEFVASSTVLDVRIGGNHFTEHGMTLDLPELSGSVAFSTPFQPWPISRTSPGIMGPFAWIPAMECYHGLVSFDHELVGELTLGDMKMDFTGGHGYIEKDWGQAFPSAYVWMQSNHFPSDGTSLSASVARIPMHGISFRGFIVGLWHNGRLTKFATHTRSKTRLLEIDDDEVRWSMTNPAGLHLSLTADRIEGGLLHAQIRTEMHRRVEETLDATIRTRLTLPNGTVAFDEVGECGGLEVHGDLDALR